MTLTRILKQLRLCQRGATAIEYALIGSLVSIAIVAAAILVGQDVERNFDDVATKMDGSESGGE